MPHTDFLSLPYPLPVIKSCHHHLSFVIKDCLSDSDGHLLLFNEHKYGGDDQEDFDSDKL